MPVIKQAIKKVRQDKKKTAENALVKGAYKKAVAAFRKNPSVEGLKKAYVALDKAAKTNVIHKNKASRLKSRLSSKLKPSTKEQPVAKATKTAK